MVAIELAYVNTKHPDFHKDAALVPSLMKNAHDQSRSRSHSSSAGMNNAIPVEGVHIFINEIPLFSEIFDDFFLL